MVLHCKVRFRTELRKVRRIPLWIAWLSAESVAKLRACGLRSGASQHVTQCKARLEARNARQPRQLILVQAAIVIDACHARDEHVIVLACHQVTTYDLAASTHCGLECAED